MAEVKELVIQTRLGPRTISAERIIDFPRGIIGFEDLHRFTLLQIKADSPFLILQSIDDPEQGLLVADPYSFMERYEIKVGDTEQKILQLQDRKDVAVLVTVTIPPGRPENTTLNLTGPVIINTVSKVGMQIPQTDAALPSHYLLSEKN
ncbi:flagellar assembly protein FliW [Desulfocurvibacter africanus]|uniref:flagellar assembly protein FliW n=1 Tax=Desulfocurvibacter africanus TaxID=873 RepID=UPI002FDB6D8F